jgi:hypothetical protein
MDHLKELPRVRSFKNTGDRLRLVLYFSGHATTEELEDIASYIQVPPRALHNNVIAAAPRYDTATIVCKLMTHMRLPRKPENYILGVTLLPQFLVGSRTSFGYRDFSGASEELLSQTCEAVLRGEEHAPIRTGEAVREAHRRMFHLRRAVDRLDKPGVTYQQSLIARVSRFHALGLYQKQVVSD